jgi:hypothetical protein
MKTIKGKYIHYVNDNVEVSNDININYNIYIVYYINCVCNSNWISWAYNQLNLIKNMDAKQIHIIATLKKEEENFFRKKILEINSTAIIECYYENEFEYRGILKVYELGQIYDNPNDILLYFHSKGVTHHKSYESNMNDNYNIIFKNIDLIKEVFTLFPKIDKIGYSCGGIGWIWYNFWYVRGSYVKKLEIPIKTTRRHYYEDYLSRIVDENDKYSLEERPISYYKNTLNSCYNIYTDKINIKNIGSFFCANTNKFFDI